MRMIFFDIETTNLSADWGQILCMSYKVSGEKKVHTLSIADDPRFFKDNKMTDKYLVKEISKVFEDADIIVSWYGKNFDERYVNSRLLFHGFPPLNPVPHIDAWEIARHKLKLSSNRLKSVSSFLGLEEKTAIKPEYWRWAATGNKSALNYVKDHCYRDVEILEQAYERIKAFAIPKYHPNRGNIEGIPGTSCPICGSKKIHKRGLWILVRGAYTRYRCMSCGHPFRDNKRILRLAV